MQKWNYIIYVGTFLVQYFFLFSFTSSSLISFPVRYRILITSYAYFHTLLMSYSHIYISVYTYMWGCSWFLSKMEYGLHTFSILLSPLRNTSWDYCKWPSWFYASLWHGCRRVPGLDVQQFNHDLVHFQCFIVKMNSKINSFPSGYIHVCGCYSFNGMDSQEWDC